MSCMSEVGKGAIQIRTPLINLPMTTEPLEKVAVDVIVESQVVDESLDVFRTLLKFLWALLSRV